MPQVSWKTLVALAMAIGLLLALYKFLPQSPAALVLAGSVGTIVTGALPGLLKPKGEK